MKQALKNKTIKFTKPKEKEESPTVSDFPPSFNLSTKQLELLKSKGIGDKCDFYIKTRIVGISQSDESGTSYRFDVEEMTYEASEKSEKEDRKPMNKAYNKATDKSKYVALRTEPFTG